ncbi:MAG: carbon monoxide dehydrogenase subunit G [Blastocatellales bacterium]
MKIEGTHTINAPRERLWKLMIDPEVIRRILPGLESLEETPDGAYRMTMKAGVGSIKGVFTGAIRLDDLRPPEHYRMLVDGKGTPGFVKGDGTLDLVEQDGVTRVEYSGNVNVGGTIASVGQRMIVSSAKMMAGQFFTALEAEAAALHKSEITGEEHSPPSHNIFITFFRWLIGLFKRR